METFIYESSTIWMLTEQEEPPVSHEDPVYLLILHFFQFRANSIPMKNFQLLRVVHQ